MKQKLRIDPPNRKRPGQVRKPDSAVTDNVAFPIIGIGASAGGLEALEQFLGAVPKDCGMAFVIIQHLDPTRKGIMSELLQRVTSMTVTQVKDRTTTRPNRVYVIPPNKDISLLHGVLHVLNPAAPRGLRLPIDFFFRSLAQDRKDKSVGVILSGMGSDGTLGIRAIKQCGGLALVQDPETAKFDSMPRSVIDAGLADIVAPTRELAGKISSNLHHPRPGAQAEPAVDGKMEGFLEKVMLLLRTHSGNDFSFYKRNTLQRRIERRMSIHKIAKSAAYTRFLQENPQEIELLFKELLIGVTSFFRDPAAWKALRAALPSLLASRPPEKTLRAWVPGCSSGEEAYSLAIELKEAVDKSKARSATKIQVFATDLDRDAIEKARLGVFPPSITADVPNALLKRYFTKVDRGYRVCKDIRDMVTFAPQNLIMDPPFTKLDILSCRNLLIYLTADIQKKIIPLFHYSLNPGGLFFQGSAETVGDYSDLFKPVSAKARLFRRTESVQRQSQVDFPTSFCSGPKDTAAHPTQKSPDSLQSPAADSLQSLADKLVLDNYVKPVLLTNDKGDIFYVSGRTGKYLEPAAGKANWNLFAMARGGLRYALSRAFPAALRHNNRVALSGVKIESDSGTLSVDVTIQRLQEPGPLQGLVTVVFTDAAQPLSGKSAQRSARKTAHSVRVTQLERELQRFQGEARAWEEEMQTSQEELRSTNEELQSTNEEMQSSNEELTTSKEEIQSMNEELQTLNAELQAKVDDLSRTSNDMQNLLNSTDIATLFLDKALKVRRFTPRITTIIKLIAADIGRPITDLASELTYPELAQDAHTVLKTLSAVEKTIASGSARWYTIRIMPYRIQDDTIDGVVITFADITVAKTLEAKLRRLHGGPAGDAEDRPAKQTAKR